MPRKQKEITVSLTVRIDGIYHPQNEFTEDEWEELMEKINQKGMEKMGYVPEDKTA